MSISEIKKAQDSIEKALNEKRIKDALNMLGKLTKEHHGGHLIDEHYNLELTYKSLLKYTVEGVNDPERQKVYNNIIISCYHLCDNLVRSIRNVHSSDIFYETRRMMAAKGEMQLEAFIKTYYSEVAKKQMSEEAGIGGSAKDLDTAVQETATQLFRKLWVLDKISNDEEEQIKKLIDDESLHYSQRCIFVSALTIGTLKEFNLEKILLLFHFIHHSHNEIKQRAITGLLLVLFKYDTRTVLYPSITSRLSLIQQDDTLTDNMVSIAIQLIRTRETEKISRKLTDEIIPEVVKMQPNLRNKLDLDNMISDRFNEGENPEWEDFFKDSPELMSKLEELSELQMEGADVFLNTFKMLKHFSFFNNISNWLIPFYIENEALKQVWKDETNLFSSQKLQDSLTNSGFLCNSDKYSLFLSVPHMPQFQKDMMGNMLEQQLEQMGEIEADEKLVQAGKEDATISNRYIQDLYRLYKLHPQHQQFEDVFAWQMDFHNKWFFHQIISKSKHLRQIAEFFFKKEYYADAKEAFNLINLDDNNQLEIIQKIGYCQQQLQNYQSALDAYQKADIIKPEQLWTTKKIALMYKLLKQNEKALEYYRIAERLKPDDLHTQASIGHCYLDLKDYVQALKYYFKVEYLDNSNTKVWRPIAWCSFVTGNFDQAEKYYQKLLISDARTQDLVNLGHVYWCKSNRKEALLFYQKAVAKMKNDYSVFFETFKEDTPTLLDNGINSEDIPIMLDQLKYLLEE
ncbi:hypothetical protein SAMN06265379_101824 [Saccharicrinis carchari]|uniref:Tetratricopeptide repeat-containing protein n=1 Tax=Saccharicrinis carchari TaxID=1168039 RepID=A0A521BAG1_SACCC|nr:tetratricopeptide repeat protein [Saccharicrinis carchari]SMO44077.1 hypothetical protein SAMN06265379_101824 [Saccharicrinis carchari]